MTQKTPSGESAAKRGLPRLFDPSEMNLKPTGAARLRVLARRPAPTPTEREIRQREDEAAMARLRRWGRQLCDRHGLRFRSIDPEREGVTEHYGICYEDGSIFIRLRHARSGKLLKESSLVDTLCHELAHLRHLDHSIRFRKLFQKILDDARDLGIYRPGATADSRPTQLSLFAGGCGTAAGENEGESVGNPFEEAKRFIPGGVDSPVRAFGSVGGTPVFVRRGHGARFEDTTGREFIDWVGSWGPLIAGHAHPRVVAAVQEQAALGTSFGAPSELETELARRMCERLPACERVRFVSSGTEATMSAIRLARGVTGRDEIVKIEGCYHGHVDSLLVQAGSGVMTLGIPGSPGIPAALAGLTHVVPFNDADAAARLFESRGDKIACLIVEPIAGNMGVIPPAEGYLQALRKLTKEHDILLILDEVMTGFRVHRSCAQGLYGVAPDLSCFGKVIGGGLPVAAYGGRTEIMEQIAPTGPVYQAGTLSGNPLAMRAGIEMLEILDDKAYEKLEAASGQLAAGLAGAAEAAGVPVTLNRVGSMMTAFFNAGPVTNYATAAASDTDRFARFFHGMLSRGVYIAPSQFEALFVSLAHGDDEIDTTVEAAGEALADLADS